MGNNCLKTSRAQNDQEQYQMVKAVEAIRRMRRFTESRSETKKKEEEEEEVERSESGGGVVRIKVVMSQEELNQILSCEDKELKYSSLEKILESAMKPRGTTTTTTTRISQVRASSREGDFTTSNWRPDLESIPEEH